jgi:uncharacterized protein YdaU (DUF1376 family)
MAKDPAFLFYTSDFLTGTSFMTDEEVGIYIRLLAQQHQCGGLLPSPFFIKRTENFPAIIEKFIKTDDGFYNKRLMEEIEKRSKKCSNLSDNAKKRWNDAKTMQLHKQMDIQLNMQPEDENEIVIKEEEELNNKIEAIYKLYPSRCPIGGRSTSKITKDKTKIKNILANKKPLEQIINNYIADCIKTKTFIKNFSSFLNQLPEIPEEIKPIIVQVKSGLPKRHILTQTELSLIHKGGTD